VDVSLEPDFQEIINDEPNDRIRNQYTDHMTLGPKYSFIFNNQDINKLKNFIFFRMNLETSGNLLQLLRYPLNAKQDSAGYFTYFGVRYSQYFKSDIDFRFYNVIDKTKSLVYRFYFGVGVPYGNSDVLPLEKGFYAGGSNGMRGWTYRLLGPGSYSNSEDVFDRMGDIQIEANIEYRFPMYKWFKGALFADIGNIWLLEPNESYPGGEIELNDFYKELAIDMGFGFRFDFDFFILRLDVAAKAVNPARPEGNRWVLNKTQFSSLLWNLGIGYPF